MALGGDDQIDGGQGHDFLWAGAGNDLLIGGEGNDLLNGGAGNDVLVGGTGHNLLWGGANSDAFVLTPGDGRDLILDFDHHQDTIRLPQGVTTKDLTLQHNFFGTTIRWGGDELAVVTSASPQQLLANPSIFTIG